MDCRVKPGNDEGNVFSAKSSQNVMPGLDPGIHGRDGMMIQKFSK